MNNTVRSYSLLFCVLSVISLIVGIRLYNLAYTTRNIPVSLVDPVNHHNTAPSLATTAYALFAPHDPITTTLLTYIENEQTAIDCAVFMITDTIIASALLAAHYRGIRVRILVDALMLDSNQQQALKMLQKTGALRIYQADIDGIMHNKFALFANNNGKKILWTGSFNWTKRAQAANHENVVVFNDSALWQQYAQIFAPLYRDALAVSSTVSLAKIRRQSQLHQATRTAATQRAVA
ncbi:phospholipase D-like domain-containing protein [Candidatus Dependentiae bacterium]|nr:phospholipase D-like domain-containing protein [Candidatus Dependentiae bacterium]